MALSRRGRLLWILIGGCGLALSILVPILVTKSRERRLQAGLEQVREVMSRGRFAAARKALLDLSVDWPTDGRVWLPLGQCEEALGKPERAIEAWARIPMTDPDFAAAAESRGAIMINLGKYTPAESFLIESLANAPVSAHYPLLRSLARLFRLQGRFVEVSEVLRAEWASAPDPSALLQELWQNDTEPIPVDAWKMFLQKADDQDDRVWLGRANLAITIGKLDDARTWLARCVEQRPEDLPVRRARLALAMAAEDRAGVWEASNRLPADALAPWEVASLRSWLAARGGDRKLEARETENLARIQPANTRALERLAVLAAEDGRAKEAEELQRLKAVVDRAKDGIHKLVVRKQDFRTNATQLAEWMSILGRDFDANAWSLVAAASAPGAPTTPARAASDAALSRLLASATRAEPRNTSGKTLAARLSDLPGSSDQGKAAVAASTNASDAPRSRLHFEDDAETAGLRFTFDSGRTPLFLLPETLSGGVGLIDFDGDGWLDVYCVQGGPFDLAPPSGTATDRGPGDRLFRNQRDGTFRDVSQSTGIERLTWGAGYGMGLAVGDYDNDGHSDLFLTRLHRYVLLHNRGGGTFEDVTSRMGLDGVRDNPTSTCFADLDADGDLDLYVCHYIRWDPEHPALCKNEQGQPYYCDPSKYERALDRVLRNDGPRFVDVTEEWGFTDPDGRGLGVVAADLDDDNRIDLFVANDGSANFLFRNKGGFRFEDDALVSGVAGNAEGGFHAGMGVCAADVDDDGRTDVLVTNLYLEGTTLYRNLGQGMFADRSAATGLFQATRYLLGFGIAALDASNRGRLDVAIANGNVNDFRPLYPNAMPTRLYETRSGGRFVDVSDQAGPPWAGQHLGRGLAAGDLDNDGLMDLVIVSQNEPLAYFHNRTASAGGYVTLQLEGTTSNRDAVGARVTVSARGRSQVAQRVGGGSYLSASDGRLHFGLGDARKADTVEVRWPSGKIDRWTDLPADTGYRLREGDPKRYPLAGFIQVKPSP